VLDEVVEIDGPREARQASQTSDEQDLTEGGWDAFHEGGRGG
jgi:hypothetical protein